MKRITLFLGACLIALTTQAQELYTQAGDGGGGIISDYFTLGTPVGVYSADDFKLGASSDISSIKVFGFQATGDLDALLTSFSLYIYTDANGVPSGNPSVVGAGVFEAIELAPTDPALDLEIVAVEGFATSYNFTVDITALNGDAPLTLAAGTYWIVAFPHIAVDNASATSGDERWNWNNTLAPKWNNAKLIDLDDIFGAGAIVWTDIIELTGPGYEGLAFTINGTGQMGVKNETLTQISLYPNPVQNQLSINLPNSIELQSATMFDLLGQQTNMNISENNTLNTSNLATGVYILKLETNQGTLTKKVIKQ